MGLRPTRRRLLHSAAGAFGLSVSGFTRDQPAGAEDLGNAARNWADFKSRFIVEGRVVDTGNDGISHSEGQGWGLFAAAYFGDQETFDRLLTWTARELRRPDDALHAWRYTPGARDPVGDKNNATDGDLFIMAALLRAAQRWNRLELRRMAEAMARDVLHLLVRRAGSRTVLLPGATGFETSTGVTLNPSYYAFPLFTEFEALLPTVPWLRLQHDGIDLLADGRFGRWMLPPDWLAIRAQGEVLTPAAAWPARFSFDAIRIPLYLSWSGLDLPPFASAFSAYWNSFDVTPAWVDLITGKVAPYAAPSGMGAVAALMQDPNRACNFRVSDAPDYYSAALILLTQIAGSEIRQRTAGVTTE